MESVPAAPSPPARASSSTLRLLLAVALGAVLGAQGSLLWMSAGGKQLRKDAAATTSIGKFESMLQQPPRGNARVEELCDPRPAVRARNLEGFCALHDHSLPDVHISPPPPPTSTPSMSLPVGDQNADAQAVHYLFTQWKKSAAEVKRLRLLADVKPGDSTYNLLYPFPVASSSSLGALCVTGSTNLFSVSTLNLWNLNIWSQRRHAIARTLHSLQLDIVGLQEVRQLPEASSGNTQAHQLSRDMQVLGNPPHKRLSHVVYEVVDAQLMEGLAILSRYPVVSHKLHLLTGNGEEKTHESARGVLHAKIQIPTKSISGNHTVDVFNVHLGIDDLPQCAHVRRLLEIIRLEADGNHLTILLGDFNAYFDFEWPVDWLTGRLPSGSAALTDLLRPCSDDLKAPGAAKGGPAVETQSHVFEDVFEVLHPPEKLPLKGMIDREDGALVAHGFTYGTQTTGHDWSRPDRILWNSGGTPLIGAPCEVGNFGVGVLEAGDARFTKTPGLGLSDHLGVVARWPMH